MSDTYLTLAEIRHRLGLDGSALVSNSSRRTTGRPCRTERVNAYQRAYYASHPELRIYQRDWKRRADEAKYWRSMGGLHELACTNDPCSCREVVIGTVAG